MEQITKNQAVATSQEAVQDQNQPQLRDENAHNDKSVHGVLNPTYQAGLRRDAVQPDIEAERKKRAEIEAGKSYSSRRFGGATCDDTSAQLYARFDKNYRYKAGIASACLRIKTKWTAGGKRENSTYPCAAREALTLRPFAINERFCQKLTRWMRRSGLICLARSSRTGLDMSHILFMVEILLLTFYKIVDYYLRPMLFNH